MVTDSKFLLTVGSGNPQEQQSQEVHAVSKMHMFGCFDDLKDPITIKKVRNNSINHFMTKNKTQKKKVTPKVL